MMLLNTPAPSLPIGSMIAYAGLLADIPTGWHICDGTNGTPDLTDSFVMGGSQAQNGQTGGANSVTPSGSVSVSVNNHTLSNSQMPNHNHYVNAIRPSGFYANGFGSNGENYKEGPSGVTSNSSGGNGAHNHGASGTLNANAQDNKPKYYKSAYIMRVS